MAVVERGQRFRFHNYEVEHPGSPGDTPIRLTRIPDDVADAEGLLSDYAPRAQVWHDTLDAEPGPTGSHWTRL